MYSIFCLDKLIAQGFIFLPSRTLIGARRIGRPLQFVQTTNLSCGRPFARPWRHG